MIAQPMRTATARQLTTALLAGGHPVSHSGGWHRTRGVCHGGDAPATLAFRDGDRPGESSLIVHCHKCGASSTAIRHALQAATGLPLCRCRACWQAWLAGQTVHSPSNRARPAAIPADKGAESRSKRKSGQSRGGEWGAHMLPFDAGAGCHCYAAACPQCGEMDALNTWTLTNHPYPYCGLALTCSCELTYDRLHTDVAGRIDRSGKRWRQDAVYTLADGRKRARIRIDPDKRLWWDSALRGAPVKGRLPLTWNHGRGLTGGPALIVEGEKAAAACVSAGMDATHVVHSVGDAAGLYQSDLSVFGGRAVTIWADNDEAGIDAALKAIPRLMDAGAAAIAVVEIAGFETKADAADIPPMAIRRAVHTAERIRA